MNKTLNKLIDNDSRFDKKLRFDKDSYGYHVYLTENYHVNNSHCIYGNSVKDILNQIKYIKELLKCN